MYARVQYTVYNVSHISVYYMVVITDLIKQNSSVITLKLFLHNTKIVL